MSSVWHDDSSGHSVRNRLFRLSSCGGIQAGQRSYVAVDIYSMLLHRCFVSLFGQCHYDSSDDTSYYSTV